MARKAVGRVIRDLFFLTRYALLFRGHELFSISLAISLQLRAMMRLFGLYF